MGLVCHAVVTSLLEMCCRDVWWHVKVTLTNFEKKWRIHERTEHLDIFLFFRPSTHISVDAQRLRLNASFMTISGGRTEQLVIIAGFLLRYEWFSQFHSCGTFSVLSQSPSIITCCSVLPPEIRSSCTTYISADVQRITLSASIVRDDLGR